MASVSLFFAVKMCKGGNIKRQTKSMLTRSGKGWNAFMPRLDKG